MGLIYVTGASGVGKSAVCGELRGPGFVAYDTDRDGLARWFENGSGVEVRLPAAPALRGDEWYANNTYRLPRETVERVGGFGSTEEELQRVLGWHAQVDADNSQYGAVLIDASPPVAEVVDRVLGWVRGG